MEIVGLKDRMMQGVQAASNAAQAMNNAAADVTRKANEATTMSEGGGSLLQGIMGNYSETSAEQLERDYGMYLMADERIVRGFKLIRDALIFTNRRIIFTNKQGATGTKMSVSSIYLDSIVDVEMETAGFGFDDSELTFRYIKSPYHKAHVVETAEHKLEFPKNFNPHELYVMLQDYAFENRKRLNS